MSAPQKPWEGTSGPSYGSDLTLSNAGALPTMAPQPSFLHPAPGTSTAEISGAPALPPRPQIGANTMAPYGQNSYGFNSYGGMGGMGAMGSYGMGGMGGYGGGFGYGGYGGGYMGGMGAPYGGYNRFGNMDLESRFIQMAEESSRATFQSIEGVVQAVGSVAAMLDNTYLAMTSSFRAILGVAENFGRMRSLFAQMWSTLAIFRSLNWLLRKLLVMLGIRTEDEFKAWARAVAESNGPTATEEQRRRGSAWPVLLFFSALAALPYIMLKLMRGLTSAIDERLNDPSTWERPLRAVATHDFVAGSPQEVSFRANQIVQIAPQHLQGALWNSGWLMGSADRQTAGLVPTTHVKLIRPAAPVQTPAPVPGTGDEKEHAPVEQAVDQIV